MSYGSTSSKNKLLLLSSDFVEFKTTWQSFQTVL